MNPTKRRKVTTADSSGRSEPLHSKSEDVTSNAKVAYAEEDWASTADFAKKMAKAREGTQLVRAAKQGTGRDDRRAPGQGGAGSGNQGSGSGQLAMDSSLTESDAGLNSSSSGSIPVVQGPSAPEANASAVSDMLEPSSQTASVLRVTGDTSGPAAAKKSPEKVFERAETKKQRQQRAKREARRAEAEEIENERKKMMERQIRGARMAEGSSAQTRTSGFRPTTPNAWFSKENRPSTDKEKDRSNVPPPLLDTFVSGSNATSSAGSDVSNMPSTGGDNTSANEENISGQKTSDAGQPGSEWTQGLPREEEQMRILQDSEMSWTTVSKRDKRKPPPPHEKGDKDSSDMPSMSGQGKIGPSDEDITTTYAPVSHKSNGYGQLRDSGFQDSDWAAG